jgi:hypothetical protein
MLTLYWFGFVPWSDMLALVGKKNWTVNLLIWGLFWWLTDLGCEMVELTHLTDWGLGCLCWCWPWYFPWLLSCTTGMIVLLLCQSLFDHNFCCGVVCYPGPPLLIGPCLLDLWRGNSLVVAYVCCLISPKSVWACLIVVEWIWFRFGLKAYLKEIQIDME